MSLHKINQQQHLMSVAKAVPYIGIGRDTLYKIIRSEPDAPVIRVGKITKINVPLFKQWLNKLTIEGKEL